MHNFLDHLLMFPNKRRAVTMVLGTRQRCRILDAKYFILDQEVSDPCAGIPCDAHEASFTFQDSIHLLESVIAANRGKSSLTFPDNPMLVQVLPDARVLLLQPKYCTNAKRRQVLNGRTCCG